jgi:predicted AAA+ superfamily ATPase
MGQGSPLFEIVLNQLSAWLPRPVPLPDWDKYYAWRWVRRGQQGGLDPLPFSAVTRFEDLHGIEDQRVRFDQNIRQFLKGFPANHVLLSGARGCGKSSLVKAALQEYMAEGLRVIEIDKSGLSELPDILALIRDRKERFVLFCDDLSFEAADLAWTSLKSLLDGSLSAPSGNVLVVATSNRRHLMPDLHADNEGTRYEGDEIHPAEAIEEKISLSDRFGLWLSFYAMDQTVFLEIAEHWATQLGAAPAHEEQDVFRHEALQWALMRSSRSGRSANQFARDWAGRKGLQKN